MRIPLLAIAVAALFAAPTLWATDESPSLPVRSTPAPCHTTPLSARPDFDFSASSPSRGTNAAPLRNAFEFMSDTAPAVYEDPPRYTSRGDASMGGVGIGFTSGPDAFLVAAQLDIWMRRHLTLGPLLQAGVSDDAFLLAPTLNLRYSFVVQGDGDIASLQPYVQAGAGAIYMNEDRGPLDDRDDIGPLLNVGMGLDFWLEDDMALGTQFNFNIMPVDVNGENFFFSWQLITLRFRM